MIAFIVWASLLAQTKTSGSSPQPARTPGSQALHSAQQAFEAGSAAFARHDLAEAHRDFLRVVTLAPKVAAGHTAYGSVLLEEGDVSSARTQLELAHSLDPQDTSAQLNLALLYARIQEYSKALPLFRSLELRSDAPTLLSAEAWAEYARALVATNDKPAAAQKLKAGIALYDDSAALHDALGSVLADQQQWSEAQPEFERAIALDKDLASAHLHLGTLYLVAGRPAEAEKELGTAAALAPNDLVTALQLGRALDAEGKLDEAVATLRHALTVSPDSVDAEVCAGARAAKSGRIPGGGSLV